MKNMKKENKKVKFTSASGKERYIDRDLSWLEFNRRVLDEAEDPATPVLEKLKFTAIFSSNLDEFIMVRMAGLAGKLPESGEQTTAVWENSSSGKLFRKITDLIRQQTVRQSRILNEKILPELALHSIRISNWENLTPSQKTAATTIMAQRIYPVLTPIGVDQSHPFPLVPNLGLEMLIRLEQKEKGVLTEKFAVLEVPPVIPRFIQVENSSAGMVFIAAEELIKNHLEMLFVSCTVKECSLFRVTRDMDLAFDEERMGGDLLSGIQTVLRKTTRRNVIRLELSSGISGGSFAFLLEHLKLKDDKRCMIRKVDGMLNLKGLFELASIKGHPDLKDPEQPPLRSPFFPEGCDYFEAIRNNQPVLLHLPYESFDPVVEMLEQAANDPDVLAIKQTLYRVGNDSPVVKALIKAARNGKQVSVLLELKARFDEENNIQWANFLAEAGAHVVYGVAGLKVHCKALMIVRREEDGIRRYMYLSSGNYNCKTARTYTDIGYFSCDRLLAKDISALFNVITGFSAPPQWDKLLVAPFNLKERLLFMIDREAAYSTKENPGKIVIKANAVIDNEIIDHLYSAAKKHVEIFLIVRGICGINPEYPPKEYAGNIHVVSILDRYLEHGRIYYFRNNGADEYFAGSSDLMPRNLHRRIEILFPVDDPRLRAELDRILDTQLNDRRKGRRMTGTNKYTKTLSAALKYEHTRSQKVLYEYYRERLKESRQNEKKFDGPLKVFRKQDKEE
ncbi:MAG: polyphosphate kinase 1 [Lentisphaeria bacterium]|nr:polyphosphate kinase 1 [Lentisphaeria bacterium]